MLLTNMFVILLNGYTCVHKVIIVGTELNIVVMAILAN